jgi:hypothetical protein
VQDLYVLCTYNLSDSNVLPKFFRGMGRGYGGWGVCGVRGRGRGGGWEEEEVNICKVATPASPRAESGLGFQQIHLVAVYIPINDNTYGSRIHGIYRRGPESFAVVFFCPFLPDPSCLLSLSLFTLHSSVCRSGIQARLSR